MKVIHRGDNYLVHNGELLLVEVDGVPHPVIGSGYRYWSGNNCPSCPLHKYRDANRFGCCEWIIGGCIKPVEEDLI